jgi:hypothetical protein
MISIQKGSYATCEIRLDTGKDYGTLILSVNNAIRLYLNSFKYRKNCSNLGFIHHSTNADSKCQKNASSADSQNVLLYFENSQLTYKFLVVSLSLIRWPS